MCLLANRKVIPTCNIRQPKTSEHGVLCLNMVKKNTFYGSFICGDIGSTVSVTYCAIRVQCIT